jgi:bacterioferritin-associated ferredoxin
MRPDDELCLCFHVSWRKVINYIRVHQIRIPSQVSECGGAGTGCGWCRAAVRKLVSQMQQDAPQASQIEAWLAEQFPSRQDYHQGRKQYIAEGRGTPPSEGLSE